MAAQEEWAKLARHMNNHENEMLVILNQSNIGRLACPEIKSDR
jgi:hypothetical protein